jgi:apolipoprotein N-acyltransferase
VEPGADRDRRLLFREGWMLVLCLVCFGAAALGLFWWSSPRGGAAWLRLALSVAVVLVAGGLAAPIVTRALLRRR